MKLSTRVANKIRLLIPKFHFGTQLSEFFLDHIRPHIYFDRWSIQPFNGQAIRYSTISAIARSFRPTVGVETGTFLGSSTPYLAALVTGEMHTIEIDRITAKLAGDRFLKNHPSAQIVLNVGDSVIEIRKVLSKLDPSKSRVLAYLDAHWYDAVPTTEELEALNSWGGSWIAIIDDFKVPNDSGYKYDVYGDLEISQEILPSTVELCLYVPNTPSERETGRRKGTGYVCRPQDEDYLKQLSELTRIN